MSYEIGFAPDALEQLRRLPARQQRIVVDAIDSRLRAEPDVPARHRKPMRANQLAGWELRVGALRVYYDVDSDRQQVQVNAIGVKLRSEVRIDGEEFQL